MFEILYLGILNHNNQIICILPNDLLIYVEIANTMKNELLQNTNLILDSI